MKVQGESPERSCGAAALWQVPNTSMCCHFRADSKNTSATYSQKKQLNRSLQHFSNLITKDH